MSTFADFCCLLFLWSVTVEKILSHRFWPWLSSILFYISSSTYRQLKQYNTDERDSKNARQILLYFRRRDEF